MYKTNERWAKMTRSAPGEKFPEVVEPPELERRRALWRAIFEADAALRRDEFAAKAAAREVEWCRSDVETAREQRRGRAKVRARECCPAGGSGPGSG